MVATVTAIDTTVELPAPTNLLNPPRFSPVVVTPEIVTLSENAAGGVISTCPSELTAILLAAFVVSFIKKEPALTSILKSGLLLVSLKVIDGIIEVRVKSPPLIVASPAAVIFPPANILPPIVVIPAIETPPCS